MSRNRQGIRSIAELAELAGVSVSTVSRALTGKGTLNPATRERIRALAAEHDFTLNVAAQNLRLGRTGAIAVVLPLGHDRGQQLSDPFFTAMLGHLAEALSEREYDLLLSRVRPESDDWLDRFMRSGRADGVIVIGQSDQHHVLDRAGEEGVLPMVVWGARDPGGNYITVGTDNLAGGAMAARHLLARGRRKLAFFGNVAAAEFAVRHAGFVSALPDDIRESAVLVPIGLTPEASYQAARSFFADGHRPDGIFAASDIVAMSVLTAAAEAGIAVPEQLSLVGFDDILLARLATPPLTTIRQDIEGGAHTLVDLLFRSMNGNDIASVQSAPTLVERGSS